jgi:hypothetical protein
MVMSHVMYVSQMLNMIGGMGDRLGLGLGFYQFDSFGRKMNGSEWIAKALRRSLWITTLCYCYFVEEVFGILWLEK